MSKVKFGWHMPSFPDDDSRGSAFIDHIMAYLDQIQGPIRSVWADDHVHPWATFPSRDTDALECMTTISYLAAAFPRLDFGSLVLCQSYRNPALLAKMAANLQLFSGGRFIFGIGAGWMEEEYRAYGWDFPRAAVRIAQLDETVQIVKKMWAESPASFSGQHYQIREAYCEPRPVPPPPIMIGGGGEKLTLRVVAKHADWWNLPGGSLETVSHKLSVLRAHCDELDRDYDRIVKTWSPEVVAVAETEAEARRIADKTPFEAVQPIVGTPAQVTEQLSTFVDVGIEYFFLRFADFPNPAGALLFNAQVIPHF